MTFSIMQIPEIFEDKQNNHISKLREILDLVDELTDFVTKSHENVSICFLIDATSSMQPYVQTVQKKINFIYQQIQTNMKKEQQIRMSIVAYRDRYDFKSIEKMDFCSSLENFKAFIDNLQFIGGSDICEDVNEGFKTVLNLDWKKDDLNLLIWIADSPCHGDKYHDQSVSDNFPGKSEEIIEESLKQLSELNLDIYFYKLTDLTDKMIEIFKILTEQKFNKSGISQSIVKNYSQSKSIELYNQFFEFVNKFEKTKQLEKCKKLKGIYKNHISLQLNKNHTVNELFQENPSYNKLNQSVDIIQEEDIKNIDDIEWRDISIERYKFQFDQSNPNLLNYTKIAMDIQISKDIIGQGSFKECYLGQDSDSGQFFALKKFKEQSHNDFEMLISEIVIHLLAGKIRHKFIKTLKENTDKSKHKDIKLFFDDLFLAHDSQNKQFYLMDIAKYGFLKFMNNDSQQIDTSQQNKNKFFQSYVHYSYEYSQFNFILTDIQGFGRILNDISIHSQTFIDNYQPHKQQQLLNQFQKGNKVLNISDLKINFPIHSNLGNLGIALFLKNHKCDEYCTLLKLKSLEQYKESISPFQNLGKNFENKFERNRSPTDTLKFNSNSLSSKRILNEYQNTML